MSTFGEDLIASLGQAVEHAKGLKTGAREYKVMIPDVKALREQLDMSQAEFAEAYRIPLPTLRGWEQGRRAPDATAAAYLNVIAHLPKEARAVLHDGQG
jgi:putative transcriptional regulator